MALSNLPLTPETVPHVVAASAVTAIKLNHRHCRSLELPIVDKTLGEVSKHCERRSSVGALIDSALRELDCLSQSSSRMGDHRSPKQHKCRLVDALKAFNEHIGRAEITSSQSNLQFEVNEVSIVGISLARTGDAASRFIDLVQQEIAEREFTKQCQPRMTDLFRSFICTDCDLWMPVASLRKPDKEVIVLQKPLGLKEPDLTIRVVEPVKLNEPAHKESMRLGIVRPLLDHDASIFDRSLVLPTVIRLFRHLQHVTCELHRPWWRRTVGVCSSSERELAEYQMSVGVIHTLEIALERRGDALVIDCNAAKNASNGNIDRAGKGIEPSVIGNYKR
jgi:hypothetical protein